MIYDVIIIGAGPAGLSAALYVGRANKKVLVLEKANYGGQIINTDKIKNYPGIPVTTGFEFATSLYNQAKDAGAEIKFETVVGVTKDKTVTTDSATYKARAIILATGAGNRELGLPRENELTGHGISYCALCDGGFYKNKVVAVNGGGSSALKEALYLSSIASKVYLIHRRDTFRGENSLLDEVKSRENIEIITPANITELHGDKKLNAISIELGDDTIKKLNLDGLFVAIGRAPNNKAFSGVVELDESGYIITDDNLMTKTKGIYVAGDTRPKTVRQLATATADGAIAATNALDEIKKETK